MFTISTWIRHRAAWRNRASIYAAVPTVDLQPGVTSGRVNNGLPSIVTQTEPPVGSAILFPTLENENLGIESRIRQVALKTGGLARLPHTLDTTFEGDRGRDRGTLKIVDRGGLGHTAVVETDGDECHTTGT